MPPASALAAFLALLIPLVLTPGASLTLVTAKGLAGDRRGAAATVAGTGLGILTHATAAGLGLAAVVMRSAQAYTAIRFAGALYLVGLGLHLLWRSRRGGSVSAAPRSGGRRSGASALSTAYLANVLNVKAAAVYLTLAPQVLPPGRVGVPALLCLGAVHVTLTAVWLGLWATGLLSARRRIDLTAWTRRLHRAGGVVLIGLGLRTAATPAP